MPFIISRNDITKIKADAIVNPTNSYFIHEGSIDKQLHDLAGEELYEACKQRAPLEIGEAYITDSYDFKNCKYIIHTVGPIYDDGKHHEEELLRKCYINCLSLCKQFNIDSIVFPLISSGTFGFPKGRALEIAKEVITNYLEKEDILVELLVYDKEAFDTSKKIFKDVKDYLESEEINESISNFKEELLSIDFIGKASGPKSSKKAVFKVLDALYDEESSFKPDISFGKYLIELIDDRGLKDSEVYKKANINRDVFNKIINDKVTKPKKKTCVALAISLKLNLIETNELLSKAGYILSNSFVFDKIIIYCISNDIYDIFEINELLFENDQEILA